MESRYDDGLPVEGGDDWQIGQAYMEKVGYVVYPFIWTGDYLVKRVLNVKVLN